MVNLKGVFRYLKGIINFSLLYYKNDDFTLSSFIDVDWASDVDDQKSTIGGAFFLGKKLVSLGKVKSIMLFIYYKS